MTEVGPNDELTRCEWCGVEYLEPEPDHAGRPRDVRAPDAPSHAIAGEVGAEPSTHCEWCGAEYPVPHEET